MDDGFRPIKKSHLESWQDRRKHPRKTCCIEANYMVEGRWYRGSIRNISKGGAYILSTRGQRFFPGEDIFLIARIKGLRGRVRAKIAWVGLQSIGIELQT